MRGKRHAFRFKFLFGVDTARDLAPHLKARLRFANHFVHPVFRYMTIRANGTHTRAITVVNCLFVFLINRVVHLVASGAKLQPIGHLHAGIKAAPKDDSREKTQWQYPK